MNEFHFDGLRMDAVGNLIYWQGGRKVEKPGSSEIYPYHESGLKGKNPLDCLPFCRGFQLHIRGVTKPVWEGGLGFDYKWDLGWMHDTLSYFSGRCKRKTGKISQADILYDVFLQ